MTDEAQRAVVDEEALLARMLAARGMPPEYGPAFRKTLAFQGTLLSLSLRTFGGLFLDKTAGRLLRWLNRNRP